MRTLRVHYIERHKVFEALCGAVASTINFDGTLNTCHFVPAVRSEHRREDPEVCITCDRLAFPQETGR